MTEKAEDQRGLARGAVRQVRPCRSRQHPKGPSSRGRTTSESLVHGHSAFAKKLPKVFQQRPPPRRRRRNTVADEAPCFQKSPPKYQPQPVYTKNEHLMPSAEPRRLGVIDPARDLGGRRSSSRTPGYRSKARSGSRPVEPAVVFYRGLMARRPRGPDPDPVPSLLHPPRRDWSSPPIGETTGISPSADPGYRVRLLRAGAVSRRTSLCRLCTRPPRLRSLRSSRSRRRPAPPRSRSSPPPRVRGDFAGASRSPRVSARSSARGAISHERGT